MMTERYEDALERIRLIPAENTTAEPFRRFFSETAEYLLTIDDWYRRFAEEDILRTKDISALREMNAALYGPLLPGGRMAEWLELPCHAGTRQPSSREARMTEGTRQRSCREARMTAPGPLDNTLSALLRELTALVPAVYEKREERITAALELFIQMYCLFEGAEQGIPQEKSVRDVLYSYFYDYSEEMQEEVLREYFDPRGSYLQRFLLETDFSSADALYRSGAYVSPAQLQRFDAVRRLSSAEIEAQLRQWRQRLVREDGMQQNADSRKSYVLLLGSPGRERLYQALARSLRDEGIGFTMPRAARGILMAVPETQSAYYESPNPRTDQMHDYDLALLMGDRLTSRLLEERRYLLTKLSGEGNVCAAVIRDTQKIAAFAAEEESERLGLRFTEHQDTVYKDYGRKAEEMTRAAIMRTAGTEEAEHETTLF